MTTILVAVIGWIIGFISSVGGTCLLERRRAIRALISAIEMERSKIARTSDFSKIHSDSVSAIMPFYFTALPFLNHEDQIKARKAWDDYRKFPAGAYKKPNLAVDIVKAMGSTVETADHAVSNALDRLADLFTRRWP